MVKVAKYFRLEKTTWRAPAGRGGELFLLPSPPRGEGGRKQAGDTGPSARAVEQRPRLLQVGRLEPLGEPAVRLGQQRPRLPSPADAPPQAGQARRRPQLQRPRPRA